MVAKADKSLERSNTLEKWLLAPVLGAPVAGWSGRGHEADQGGRQKRREKTDEDGARCERDILVAAFGQHAGEATQHDAKRERLCLHQVPATRPQRSPDGLPFRAAISAVMSSPSSSASSSATGMA
jgi:hypothetical protein